MRGAIPPLTDTSSWRSAQLSRRAALSYLYLTGYPRRIFIVFLSLFRRIPVYYLTISHDSFLPNSYLHATYDDIQVSFDAV